MIPSKPLKKGFDSIPPAGWFYKYEKHSDCSCVDGFFRSCHFGGPSPREEGAMEGFPI